MARLDEKEFARFKALSKLAKEGKLSDSEKAELEALVTKRGGAGKVNDPIYYNAGDDSLLKDVASLSFGTFPGQRFEYGDSVIAPAPAHGMVIWFYPNVGVNKSPTDPINVAGRKNYARVRSANSGAKNYEQPDLTIYNTGYYSCILGLMVGNRVIKTVSKFSIKNKTLPTAMLEGMGFDFNDVSHNLPNYRARIKLLTLKLQTLSVPRGQMIINRWAFLCENIFVDAKDEKASWIICMPTQLYQYDSEIGTNGGLLKPVDIRHAFANFGAYLDKVEEMIDALVGDDDSAMMSGDQLKAYGSENSLGIGMVDLESPQPLVYSEDFLLQLHNAICLGVAGDSYSFSQDGLTRIFRQRALCSDVTLHRQSPSTDEKVFMPGIWISQEGGQLVSTPHIVLGTLEKVDSADDDERPEQESVTFTRLLDTNKEAPTPGEVMEYTRFNYSVDYGSCHAYGAIFGVTTSDHDQVIVGAPLVDCGTEIISEVVIYSLEASTGTKKTTVLSSVLDTSLSGTVISEKAVALSNFDWHHAVYTIFYTYATSGVTWSGINFTIGYNIPHVEVGVVFDTVNYTSIQAEDVRKMNNLAVYSELLIRI